MTQLPTGAKDINDLAQQPNGKARFLACLQRARAAGEQKRLWLYDGA